MKKLGILLSIMMIFAAIFTATSCAPSVVLDDIVGTYYCYAPNKDGYRLSEENYITLTKDFKCRYNMPVMATLGVYSLEETVGECNFTYDGETLNIAFFHTKDYYIQDGMIRIGNYFLCKEGVVPYEISEGVKYARYSADSYAVLGCEGKEDITIGSIYKGSPVKILTNAFLRSENLRTVTISDGIDKIGTGAFAYCFELQKVVIPSNVKEIGQELFRSCTSLNEVSLGGITEVPPNMFFGCLSLETLVIPDTVTRIEGLAFAVCSSLRSIEIPTSVKFIDLGAFSQNDDLVINYGGTAEQWNNIEKAYRWVSSGTIKCTDKEFSFGENN